MDLPLPTVPPSIETGLPDLSATEGTHALLPCTARGSPEPHITWEKDGQPVSGAVGKFTVLPSGELLVKNSEVRVLAPQSTERNSNWNSKHLLSHSVLSTMQFLIPGTWKNRYFIPDYI